MSYTDTSLAVQATYTYIHCKQVYDQIASQLSIQGAWAFVESVDFVSGTTTATTYVWKNLSAVSGMTKDWYVAFQTVAVSGVYTVTDGLRAFLFEDYNSTTHVASKYANRINASSMTLNADGSVPYTWTLTAAYPNADPQIIHQCVLHPVVNSGTTGYTSLRLLTTISNTTIVVFQLAGGTVAGQFYVGAFDTFLGSTLDPLPVLIGQSQFTGISSTAKTNLSAGNGTFASTRHPSQGSATGINFNNFTVAQVHNGSSAASWGSASANLFGLSGSATQGVLGNTGDTSAGSWLGVPTSRAMVWSAGNGTSINASTRGGLRGVLKHVAIAFSATHTFGDTFLVDSAAFAGMGLAAVGSISLLDTSA